MTTLLTRGRALGAIAIGLLILAAYLASADTGRSQDILATVSVSSTLAEPNSQTTVDLVVTPEANTVGALAVTVTYDGDLLGTLSGSSMCTAGFGGICNAEPSLNQVHFTFVSVTGVSGIVGTITFNTHALEGVATLAVAVTTCADTVGSYGTCATQDGTITITVPTPTPSPSPLKWGDVTCDGEVTAVDALAILRSVAALPVSQVAPCPTIGTPYP